MRRVGVSLTLCLLAAQASAQRPSPEPPLRTLVTARQIHDLPREEAARAYPVHMRAVVTYFDPELNQLPDLFVCDSTGGIFVEFSQPPNLALQAGDLVDVTGESGPGEFAPVIRSPQVRTVGRSSLPENAIKATYPQLLSGSLDGQWVEIEGVVHAAHSTATNVTLDVATLDGSVRATTRREAGVNYDGLVDSSIRFYGNAAPVLNWKQQMVGAQIFFPSLREIAVMMPAPLDPFATPVVPLSDLMRFSPSLEIPHRVHVKGTVTLQWPGRTLCIQQQSNSLCMDTDQQDRLGPGNVVDAIGFPAIHDYKRTLENANFSKAADGAPPGATRISADQALSGRYDSDLVEIEGQLVGKEHALGDVQLMLRAGSILVPAILPSDLAGRGTPDWKDGSILRLTGICVSLASAETWDLREGEVQPGSVRILLRSIGDVQIVQRPSWWTREHALAGLAAAGAVSLAAFAWIVVLGRRVDQQTQALRESEERLRHLSQHDALTRLPNRLLLHDRLTVALHRAERFKEGLAILMVDLDRFKQINDVHGHQAGDKVLTIIAKRLLESVRLTDTVARIGGDEFIVLLPDLREVSQAESIAAKIIASVIAPIDLGADAVSVTVSVGICTYPLGGRDAETLMQNVDGAMYAVKAHGRNAFQVFTPAGT
ncbi:MAG: GGDEF domain-containing protein [Terracidiphilus sp.]